MSNGKNEKPQIAVIEKLGRRGWEEYRWGLDLGIGGAAVFFKKDPPIYLNQLEAFNKYLAIDSGLEPGESIELLTWFDENNDLKLLQANRPGWAPQIRRSGLIRDNYYAQFNSSSGLYTIYFGVERQSLMTLVGSMQLASDLRN